MIDNAGLIAPDKWNSCLDEGSGEQGVRAAGEAETPVERQIQRAQLVHREQDVPGSGCWDRGAGGMPLAGEEAAIAYPRVPLGHRNATPPDQRRTHRDSAGAPEALTSANPATVSHRHR